MATLNVTEDKSFDPARRGELLKEAQKSYPKTLAEIALRKHHEIRAAAEEKEKRDLEAQRKASEEYAFNFQGKERDNHINLLLSTKLDGEPFDEAFDAQWRMDPENLSKAEFNTGSGVQGIVSGNLRYASLFTEVVKDALWMEAAPWG